MTTPAELVELVAEYPTIARLADPAQTTIGYQGPDLVREACACYRELQRARDEIVALNETWFDGKETWTRPTAWAYAQICRVAIERRERVAALEAEIVRVTQQLAIAAYTVPGHKHLSTTRASCKSKLLRSMAQGRSMSNNDRVTLQEQIEACERADRALTGPPIILVDADTVGKGLRAAAQTLRELEKTKTKRMRRGLRPLTTMKNL